jgi:hypothetical protein
LIIPLLVVAIVLTGLAAYVVYEVYLPQMIARSITDESTVLMPDKVEEKIQKIKKPVNRGAEVVVETIYKSGISMDQIFKAIDETEEEQAFAFLAELNNTRIESSDQVFNIAKKHFPVEFNVEVFRKPFNERVNVATIKKGVKYANIYKDREEFDTNTAKSIMKRVLLEKEEEFRKITENVTE